jgi:hypothetical protein
MQTIQINETTAIKFSGHVVEIVKYDPVIEPRVVSQVVRVQTSDVPALIRALEVTQAEVKVA